MTAFKRESDAWFALARFIARNPEPVVLCFAIK